jgi:hypothetical protein
VAFCCLQSPRKVRHRDCPDREAVKREAVKGGG